MGCSVHHPWNENQLLCKSRERIEVTEFETPHSYVIFKQGIAVMVNLMINKGDVQNPKLTAGSLKRSSSYLAKREELSQLC